MPDHDNLFSSITNEINSKSAGYVISLQPSHSGNVKYLIENLVEGFIRVGNQRSGNVSNVYIIIQKKKSPMRNNAYAW